MEGVLKYRGRLVTPSDLGFIRDLVVAHPGMSRRALSKKLCEAWGWHQPNGLPCDMICRGLMLKLHRAGAIELPPVRQVNPNPLLARTKPLPATVDRTPLKVRLAEVEPLEFVQVRRRAEEGLFNSLIEEHHYLGYTHPVGEHLKYLVYAGSRPVACFAWSSAPRHLGPRDRFLGWSPEARKRNLRCVAYNTRFLILPWVEVPHLASHLLGRMTRRLSGDWQALYGHPIHFVETFVDPLRFRGTCYRAANWISLGMTTGRGHNSKGWKPTQPKKEVLGLPLTPHFRELLGGSA